MSDAIVFIFRSSPLGNARVGTGIDLLLTTASFDRPVHVVFIDAGIENLRAMQSVSTATRNPACALTALELYGIDRLLVSESDMAAIDFPLSEDTLLEPVSDDALRTLIAEARQVMVF